MVLFQGVNQNATSHNTENGSSSSIKSLTDSIEAPGNSSSSIKSLTESIEAPGNTHIFKLN